MSAMRQDAWTQDEDVLLAEVVLRHIRDGSTQLKAFEEVGKKLSRTAAACGFRWNSYVRKQYQSGIELAKKQRKQVKKEFLQENEAGTNSLENSKLKSNDTQTVDEIIVYLTEKLKKADQYDQVVKEKQLLGREIEALTAQLNEEKKQFEQLKTKYDQLEEDYRSLLYIMERARKLAVDERN
ncbi:RsfA family transcriptional regulator [Bacillus smithii]|uniref:RsfA family transcriptional regulator n=1 Tax=Bacillus smithii TaxID=1479 RepID=UPI003D211340